MYIDTATYVRSGKRYKRYLLRESYRENGKVKKRTLASLCSLKEEEIKAIKLALQHKSQLTSLTSMKDLKSVQGKSYGALILLEKLAKELGITKVLGSDSMGKLALWQILGRVLFQGSRLSLLRGLDIHLAKELLSLGEVTAKKLYTNLSWLEKNQDKIEKELWQQTKINTNLYLYDVTSSYLEGDHNELSAYGYNRDKKRGKKQIVVGLLTNSKGYPVAVRVFKGNTSDSKTVSDQIKLLQEKFEVKRVTLVGDKAMLPEKLIDNLPEEFSYITSISKPQIQKLIDNDILQLSLFDTDIREIEVENKRYIFRCNPVRKEEISNIRISKLQSIKTLLKEKNEYLSKHKKAKPETALRNLDIYAEKLKINKFVSFTSSDRNIHLTIDQKEIDLVAQLDGCYCITTNIKVTEVDKDTIHARYKDLALVESAFRAMKQTHLEIRPIFLRRKDRTKAHVFVTMLAFMIEKRLAEYWKDTEMTITDGLNALSTLTTSIVEIAGVKINTVNQPNKICKKLLNLAGVDAIKRVPTETSIS